MQETQPAEMQAARLRAVSVQTVDEPLGGISTNSAGHVFPSWCFIFRSLSTVPMTQLVTELSSDW